MTPSYLIFLTFMSLTFLLLIGGYIRLLLFLKRQKLLEKVSLNPVTGLILWKRIFTRNGFGCSAEAQRRGVARLYLLAVVAFGIGIALFFALPALPR